MVRVFRVQRRGEVSASLGGCPQFRRRCRHSQSFRRRCPWFPVVWSRVCWSRRTPA